MPLLEGYYPRKLLGGQVSLFALWVGITIVGLLLPPDPAGHGTHQKLGLPPCPSVLLFDRPCPGCGLTTSWTALLHGNWSLAFHAHALGPPAYLIFSAYSLLSGYAWLKMRRVRSEGRLISGSLIACASIFLVYGLVRMATTQHFQTPSEHLLAQFIH